MNPHVKATEPDPDEASKFPDDPIRVEDHPLVYTEGCIAAGCPEDLW
jgi:hypothetical protein